MRWSRRQLPSLGNAASFQSIHPQQHEVLGEAPGVADTVSACHLLEEREEIKHIYQVPARYQSSPSSPSSSQPCIKAGIIILIYQIRKEYPRS